jgi:hypothetical protein
MTEFLGTNGGQIAYKVTGLTAAADEVVAVRPELVWDLVADVTRVGGWSPECVRAAWLAEPGRPSSSWRYRIDPLPGGSSRVRQSFTHGPGASYLRAAAAQAPDRAAEIIAARRDGLRASMSTTLRAIKAAAESSYATGAGPGQRASGPG